MVQNSTELLTSSWKARLTLRPDAWTVSPVKDGHNAWRNDPGAIKIFTPPAEIPATVPGSIHTDLIAAGVIKDISIDGKEQDQFWIWKTDTEYITTLKKRFTSRKQNFGLSWPRYDLYDSH